MHLFQQADEAQASTYPAQAAEEVIAMAAQKRTAAEKVQNISLNKLYPHPNHPIKMREDESFHETLESIRERGVLVPILVRPREAGDYEIISGRRRMLACEMAGIAAIPAIVRTMDDDEAIIALIDSNVQRDYILPSEKAASYKMRLEAIKRQGTRNDLTCNQVGDKSDGAKIVQMVADDVGESKTQVQRYIRLTELIPPLLDMVDEKKIAFNPAYELSFLTPTEQEQLMQTIESEQVTPSLSQAQRMKKLSKDGVLTEDSMLEIMCEQKKPAWDKVTLGGQTLRKFFPQSYTPKQIEDIIFQLLEMWHKQQSEN